MEPKEFTDIYLPLSEGLYRVAYYMLESGQEARDAVQDLFVKLWSNRDALDSVHNPKAYGITLMRNLCIDRIRKRRGCGDTPAESIADSGDIFRHVCEREKLARTMEIVDRLPERHREVLRMKVLEDLSYEEMSERTGMSGLTLRVILSQARKKIRTYEKH